MKKIRKGFSILSLSCLNIIEFFEKIMNREKLGYQKLKFKILVNLQIDYSPNQVLSMKLNLKNGISKRKKPSTCVEGF
tara:strand:+ start:1140 stop:1373 length:234 start_codon:yes stop_codon:yes gene_type:complete